MAALVAVCGAGVAVAMASGALTAGPRSDGTAVTPYGWTVTPAGTQLTLGDKPFGTTRSPDGKSILVSNDGQYVQSLSVVDAATGTVRQTLRYTSPEALFVGVAYSPEGRHVYASAGGNNKLRTYDVQPDGRLAEGTAIPLPMTNPAGAVVNHFPAGVTVSADGTTVRTANSLSGSVSEVDVATKAVHTFPVGANPYAVALGPDGTHLDVSDWGANTVSVLDAATGAPLSTGRDPQHSYLWDALDQAGVSYRNFGFWRFGNGPVAATAPNLAAHTDLSYPGYGSQIKDQTRMDASAAVLQRVVNRRAETPRTSVQHPLVVSARPASSSAASRS